LGSVVTEMALEAEIHDGVKYIVGTRLPEDTEKLHARGW